MASVKNDWIGYLNRSYLSIKTSVLARVKNANKELTDFSESNPFVIIISIFSAIAEMMGYYIDNIAEEGFLATAQRRTSIIKHSRQNDYRIRARSPERVDIVIVWNIPVPAPFTLSAGFFIQSTDGIGFFSLVDVNVLAGDISTNVPVAQVSPINNAAFGLTDGSKNQKINLGTLYVHKSLQLTIGVDPYTEVDTFGYLGLASKSYIVDIDVDGNAYAILGDGIKGVIPIPGLAVGVIYSNTLGVNGKVGAGGFNSGTIIFNNVLPGGLLVGTANSVLASSGGSGYEDTEFIRTNSVLSIRTLDRAVTRQDFIDIASMVSGVAKASLHFCCGKTIDIYVVPVGGGIASGGLLATVQAVLDDKKMVTTFPKALPAGQTQLVIGAQVSVKKRKSIAAGKAEVIAALLEFGQPANQEINGAIRLSDIQALIDNLSTVDFVDLTILYTKPYARPINHVNNLVWVNETRPISVLTVGWILEYSGVNIRIFRNGVFITTVAIGVQYIHPDNTFLFTVNAGAYVAGNRWEFNTYPYLKNIQLTDFTIFGIAETDLSINVKPFSNNPITEC